MRLTAQEIARYRPPQGKDDHIVFDEDLSGFGLRYRAGKRVWIYQYAFGSGEERTNARMTLGEYPALSPAKARDTAQDLYAKVRLGQHPASDKRKNRSEARHTFGRLVATYLERQRGEMRDSSHAEVSRYLDRYASSLHGLPASAIDRKRIADLLDTIAKEHGVISANRARGALSALFGWAIRRGLHDNNPVIGTEQRKERTRDRVLSDAELAAIWNAADTTQQQGSIRYGANGNSDFHNIVRLLIMTGQRASEIAGLRWNEINFDEDLIALPAERTKNGHPHTIPLSPLVRDILKAQAQTRGLVFGFGDTGFVGWHKAKKRLDERIADKLGAPLPHWTIHDLRRTLATGFQRLGVRLEVTEAILNHVGGSRSGVAGIYQRHDWATEKRVALDAWAAHVLTVVSGKGKKGNVTPIRGRAS
jgi:integrase